MFSSETGGSSQSGTRLPRKKGDRDDDANEQAPRVESVAAGRPGRPAEHGGAGRGPAPGEDRQARGEGRQARRPPRQGGGGVRPEGAGEVVAGDPARGEGVP